MITKHSHPNCFAVAYCGSTYFRYHAFKVREDREFILRLIASKDLKNLDYMEQFYKDLYKEDRDCEKDFYSRNDFKILPLSYVQGVEDEGFKEGMKDFEEIKIKKPKKRAL